MIRRSQQNKEVLILLLKQIRNDAQLRQTDLAEKLGKPQSYISKYESGEKTLDILELMEVCDSLDVSLSSFVNILEKSI